MESNLKQKAILSCSLQYFNYSSKLAQTEPCHKYEPTCEALETAKKRQWSTIEHIVKSDFMYQRIFCFVSDTTQHVSLLEMIILLMSVKCL